MSTNYYFYNIKKKKIVDDNNAKLDNLIEKVKIELKKFGLTNDYFSINAISNLENLKKDYDQETQIHICKYFSKSRSPLFEVPYNQIYFDLKSMKDWYIANKDIISIQDEYGIPVSWETLENEIIHVKGKTNYNEESEIIVQNDNSEWFDGEFS